MKRTQSDRLAWLGLLAMLLTWPIIPTVTTAEERRPVRFNQDGFLLIDGKPRLILGCYDLPKEDERLVAMAKSGFNLVRATDTASLDRLQRHGFYGWMTIPVALRENDDATRQRLTTSVEAVKSHPALLAWELPDEALWNVWYGRQAWALWEHPAALREAIVKAEASAEQRQQWAALLAKANDYRRRALFRQAEEIEAALWKALGQSNPQPAATMSTCPEDAVALCDAMTRGCALLRQLDPVHPIWLNHAPRNSLASLERFNRMGHIAGCDIYMVPPHLSGHSDLSDRSLAAVGTYTRRMAQAAPGKAVWMVLQGFGWGDLAKNKEQDADSDKGRRPQWAETRFMAYDALVHGANGLLYWGTSYIEPDCELWRQLHRIARELRALEPGLVGTRPGETPITVAAEVYGSVDGHGPCLMLRQTGDDWVLMAVNETPCGLPFTVKNLPAALEGKTLYRLGTEENHTVRDREFADGIASFDVHVYATSRRFEPLAEAP